MIEAFDNNTPIQQKSNKDLYQYVRNTHRGIEDESKAHYQLVDTIFTKFNIPKRKPKTYAFKDYHPVSLDRVKELIALVEAEGGTFDYRCFSHNLILSDETSSNVVYRYLKQVRAGAYNKDQRFLEILPELEEVCGAPLVKADTEEATPTRYELRTPGIITGKHQSHHFSCHGTLSPGGIVGLESAPGIGHSGPPRHHLGRGIVQHELNHNETIQQQRNDAAHGKDLHGGTTRR